MTVETLEVAFGATMDGLAILCICLIPVFNFVIRIREIAREIDEMYWWEKEENVQ